jgi:hypothetical protein
MSNQTDDNVPDEWSRGRNEARSFNRVGQIIQRVLIQGAEAQKSTARNLEKNARLMVWSVLLTAISTVISAGALVFVVIFLLRNTH